jgi:hypothetical protein
MAALTLNDQLLARLPEREALQVLSAPSANSLQELLRQREFIIEAPGAAADPPEWILDVSVVVTVDAAHVVVLIYQGSGFLLEDRETFVQTFTTREEIVFEVPRAIAERVADAIGG